MTDLNPAALEAAFEAFFRAGDDATIAHADGTHAVEEAIEAYLSALPAPVAPAGWKLVPVEPTKPMIFYGMDAIARDGLEPAEHEMRTVYRAMLAAAPTPPIGSGEAPFRAALQSLVSSLDDLIADSVGIFGLHQNGDLAPWDDLLRGGEFEAWLRALDDARDLLSGAGEAGEVRADALEAAAQIADNAGAGAVAQQIRLLAKVPPGPATPRQEVTDHSHAARLARLHGILHRLRWKQDKDGRLAPAISHGDTLAALNDLGMLMLSDALDRAAEQASGPAAAAPTPPAGEG